MLKRSITGSVILLITLLFIVLKQFSPIFFDVYVLIIMYGGLYEMFKSTPNSIKNVDYVTLGIVPALACLIFNLEKDFNKLIIYIALLAVLVLIVILTEEIIIFANDRRYGVTEKNVSVLNKTLFYKTKATMSVFAYPMLPLLFLMALNHISYKLAYVGLILTFSVSMLTDTMAYFVGRLLGKRKFIPEVSPNKTIAGMVGGFIGGILASTVCYFIFTKTSLLNISEFASTGILICVFIAIGVIGSFITQLGDLIASAYKRRHNIKDFSNIFPGHGGFLDRVDGLMFNSVFIYVIFVLFLV